MSTLALLLRCTISCHGSQQIEQNKQGAAHNHVQTCGVRSSGCKPTNKKCCTSVCWRGHTICVTSYFLLTRVCCSICCMPAIAPLILLKSAAACDVGLLPVPIEERLPVVVLHESSPTDDSTSGALRARSLSSASSLSSSCIESTTPPYQCLRQTILSQNKTSVRAVPFSQEMIGWDVKHT